MRQVSRVIRRHVIAGPAIGVALLLSGCASTQAPRLDSVADTSASNPLVGTALANDDAAPRATDIPVGTEPDPGDSSTSVTTDDAATSNDTGATAASVTTSATSATSTAPGRATTTKAATLPTAKATSTTTPTTAPPKKPTLFATGPNGGSSIHCEGPELTSQASPTWTTTGATEVAVALGKLDNAFDLAYNPSPLPQNGTYPVPVSCTSTATQYTTVSARGPGGTVTKVITWSIHHM